MAIKANLTTEAQSIKSKAMNRRTQGLITTKNQKSTVLRAIQTNHMATLAAVAGEAEVAEGAIAPTSPVEIQSIPHPTMKGATERVVNDHMATNRKQASTMKANKAATTREGINRKRSIDRTRLSYQLPLAAVEEVAQA